MKTWNRFGEGPPPPMMKWTEIWMKYVPGMATPDTPGFIAFGRRSTADDALNGIDFGDDAALAGLAWQRGEAVPTAWRYIIGPEAEEDEVDETTAALLGSISSGIDELNALTAQFVSVAQAPITFKVERPWPWRLVDQEPPPPGEKVWAWVDTGNFPPYADTLSRLKDGRWFDAQGVEAHAVTHWAPIVAPALGQATQGRPDLDGELLATDPTPGGLDLGLLSGDVLGAIRQSMGARDETDAALDDVVQGLAPVEAFEKYLSWYGLDGYVAQILEAIQEIRSSTQ